LALAADRSLAKHAQEWEVRMHVGVMLPVGAGAWAPLLQAARHAEETGGESIWVPDHLYPLRPGMGMFEAWTIMTAVAASTERVQIGAQVLCQSFRSPALLAKMAATLDHVSDGRLRMVIGAGWFEAEYEAFGWDFPPPGVRVDQLRDAVRILKGLLNNDAPFSYEGPHYCVHEAVNLPPPIRRPMTVEVGGTGDRMLRLIAEEADGWSIPWPAPGVEERVRFLEEACEKAGRPFRDLRLSCTIFCAVGDEEATSDPRYAMFRGEHGLVGSVDQAVQRAGELMDLGIQDFAVALPGGARGRTCLERLLGEVRPQLAARR
jgi:alkanesulfonate monooxygenase SsuD/methylene tetrahydromethanopterin reductase-like flavin-dependent oxidoreductase (luciferase family)